MSSESNFFDSKSSLMSVWLPQVIRWYAAKMKDFLFRFKILTLFILLLLQPSIKYLISLVIAPAKALITHDNMQVFIITLVAVEIVIAGWVYLHRAVFDRVPGSDYVNSLPISSYQFFLVDLLLLLIIDFVIWLSMSYVLISNLIQYGTHADYLFNFIAIMASVIAIQLLVVKKKYIKLALILPLNMLIVLMNRSHSITLLLIFTFVMLSLIYLLIQCYQDMPLQQQSIQKNSQVKLTTSDDAFLNARSTFKHLIFHITFLFNNIYHIKYVMALICILTCIVIPLFFVVGESYKFSIYLMLVVAFLMSTLIKPVHSKLNEYRMYFSSLPVSSFYSSVVILLLILFPTLTLNCVIAVCDWITCSTLPVSQILIILLSSLLYLILVYLPRVYLPRYGLLVSLAMLCQVAYIDFVIT